MIIVEYNGYFKKFPDEQQDEAVQHFAELARHLKPALWEDIKMYCVSTVVTAKSIMDNLTSVS